MDPLKIEKVLFYNMNSAGKIWHAFCGFGEKVGKMQPFGPKVETIAGAPQNSKSAILQLEFNTENLAYIFVFREKEKKIKLF